MKTKYKDICTEFIPTLCLKKPFCLLPYPVHCLQDVSIQLHLKKCRHPICLLFNYLHICTPPTSCLKEAKPVCSTKTILPSYTCLYSTLPGKLWLLIHLTHFMILLLLI